MKAITNATLISQGQALDDYTLVFDQKIRALCPAASARHWPITEIIDAQGCFVVPGLIDIHVHGYGGHDVMDASVAGLQAMATLLAKQGVTSFLASTMTAPWTNIEQALAAVRTAQTDNYHGARILGVHLEGPFLNPDYKGAHAADWLALPAFEPIAAHLDIIRVITLAPELPGSGALLERLAAYPHVVASIGHSGANFATTQQAIKQGVRHATHLFNAMSPLHHRQPGLIGAVLASGLSAEIIADNLHLHPSLYSLLLKTQGKRGLILVSDAMRAAGLAEGEYELGGQMVRVAAGAARLPDGTLAGSILTLPRAIANFQQATGCSLADAVGLATRNPARLLGLSDKIGDLAVGLQADIVVMDGQCGVQQTFLGGEAI